MMKIRMAMFFSVVGAIALLDHAAVAQEPPKPGAEHAMLKQQEGTWDAVLKGGPAETKCVAEFKMACGGLWLVSSFKGNLEGMPFEGHGVDGYDLEKKKYTSVWFDSMSTSPMTFEGTYDEKTKTLTQIGEGKGPDGKPAKFKSVTKYTDKDHQTFTMSLVGADGADIQMMTIEYTRRKSK